MRTVLVALLSTALPALAACTTDDTPSPSTPKNCAADRRVGDKCVGLTSACVGSGCAAGVTCASTVKVASSEEATRALASATPGTCLTLAAGNYGELSLPPGVSALGEGVDGVNVAKLTIQAGDGANVRGLTVTGGGILVDGATGVLIESVAVRAASGFSLALRPGSHVRVSGVELDAGARGGIVANDVAALTVDRTLIAHAQGPGLWAECSACGCGKVDLTNSVLADNRVVGVALAGVQATLQNVEIAANAIAKDLSPGAGVAAFRCASLNASNVSVHDNTAYGVLVDASTGSLDQIEVRRNSVGVWVQNLDAQAKLTVQRGRIVDNAGVGIGLANATGVVVRDSEVAGTRMAALPTFSSGSISVKEVGDGLSWSAKAQATVSGLTVRGSARSSILIDGAVGAGSRFDSFVLADGDETKGILQQNLPEDGLSPEVGPNLPGPQREKNEIYAIPQPLKVPALTL